jgi:hypothetical protein
MLLHQDKYKTIPYRADIATYNQMGSGCSAIKFPMQHIYIADYQ